MKIFKKYLILMVLAVMGFFVATGCTSSQGAGTGASADGGGGKIKIGLSLDTLKEERWQKDRDIFTARAEELGAEVHVQSADGDDATQLSQAENLITQGIDVLVVVPHNASTAAAIVESAHEADVKVLSYDRLILDSEVDLYISFDNEKVGEMQAEYMTHLVPEGNYVLIGGAPTDNNAKLLRQGQMNVLQPLIDSGAIEIVHDEWATDWLPEEALKIMENALTANHNRIDAVVASNDATAGGAIEALAAQKLAGKVPISGQDADLAAVQRIVEGTQAMTVYKPLNHLATKAAEIAVQMAIGEEVETEETIHNGLIDLPAVLLEPISVDKDNMVETLIQDGFYELEEVYKNVPESEWPTE